MPSIPNGAIARVVVCAGVAAPFVLAPATSPTAATPDDPTILQWFECPWPDMTHRMPDFFEAGYDAVWMPPVGRAADDTSPGYDAFDRKDLGTFADPTTYGHEDHFRALNDMFDRAGGSQVFVDLIMNHNSARTSDTFFQSLGGWPGFWLDSDNPPVLKGPLDPWGDFHGGNAGGFLQSENPNGANYDLHRGDLVGLIDIDQAINNMFIRHPVVSGDPRNIPAGSLWNRPDASNARFYPDRDLAPMVVRNPGTARNPAPTPPGYFEAVLHPFNTADPMAGDAVEENATGLLLRMTQWLMDEFGVDGFRLDAAKHIPSWFWDNLWDAVVHERRRAPDGTMQTAFTFVESVMGNFDTFSQYTRKDGFAQRDALDLNGAGALRGVVNAQGFGTWGSALGAHIDLTDDGLQNGSLGVNHPFSHDNGSAGTGSSAPPLPNIRQQGMAAVAYTLFRPGPPIVYHNARGIARTGGFFPRQGTPNALGLDPTGNNADDAITGLVRARNMVARGEFHVLNGTDPVNPSTDDVLIFERRTNGQANCLVGVNDTWLDGVSFRSVLTTFPPGTRLHELSGTATSLIVDPLNQVADVLVVDSSGRVLIPVPNNRSSSGVDHGRGYVVYAPPLPSGKIEWPNLVFYIPEDDASVPEHRRRLTDLPVIQDDQFEIRLTTTQTDPLDPNVDDNAVFRINAGFRDFNGNGAVDIGSGAGPVSGYEQFVTLRSPLATGTGEYRQVIDATALPEGVNFLSVLAFRQRPSGAAPLFREWREAFYLDRVGPDADLITPGPFVSSNATVAARNPDRTAERLHFFLDLPAGSNPTLDATNIGRRIAEHEWSFNVIGVGHGFRTVNVFTVEEPTGTTARHDFQVFFDLCAADINNDGQRNTNDFFAFLALYQASDPGADFTGEGDVNTNDFFAFLAAYQAGC